MSFLRDIPFEQLEGAVRQAAQEQPDHVTEACQYFNYPGSPAEKPCCLLGTAFHALGFTANDLPKCDNGTSTNQSTVDHYLFELRDIYTIEQGEWLTNVQYNQDAKKTWAESVELADAGKDIDDE